MQMVRFLEENQCLKNIRFQQNPFRNMNSWRIATNVESHFVQERDEIKCIFVELLKTISGISM